MLEILRWTLIAYIFCGLINALIGAYRDHLENERNLSDARMTARVVLLTLLGFLPVIPHIWRFTSSLPSAFRLEVLDARARAVQKREERELFPFEPRRNFATFDPRDEVQP